MNILFIDVETTGFIPNKHDIIKFAYIVWDYDKKEIVCTKTSYLRHTELVVCPAALKVNNIDLRDTIREGMSPLEFKTHLEFLMKDHKINYIAGWNVNFDVGFLKKYLPVGGFYKTIDVMQMYFFDKGIDKHSLEYVAKALNIEHIPHDSTSDITATLELFKKKGV